MEESWRRGPPLPEAVRIVEYDDRGQANRQAVSPRDLAPASSPEPLKMPARARKPSDIQLHFFQTGTLRTKLKYIKMNQGDGEDYEIPVPWFLIKHPAGTVVIDGGNAIEAAIDKRAHWGAVVDAYDPIMDVSENCVDQARSVGVEPEDVRFVLQSHLHLDHTGALGHFPRAQTFVQRIEHQYAFAPDWFASPAYIRKDFDRPELDWYFLGGEETDDFDLFGDGTIRMIFTPGHAPGHQSFLVTLPNTGPMLLCIDAAYTIDHWNERALPGLVTSSSDAARSVKKLHRVADRTNAQIVTGHDPDAWPSFTQSPSGFYD